jgi:transposase-like protein
MTQKERRQIWKARVSAYQASGQSATAWCAAHQVTPRQLWYWQRKFKNTESTVTATAGSRWVPVDVEKHPNETESALLVRVGPAAIEVKPGYNPVLLSDVVKTLQALC